MKGLRPGWALAQLLLSRSYRKIMLTVRFAGQPLPHLAISSKAQRLYVGCGTMFRNEVVTPGDEPLMHGVNLVHEVNLVNPDVGVDGGSDVETQQGSDLESKLRCTLVRRI